MMIFTRSTSTSPQVQAMARSTIQYMVRRTKSTLAASSLASHGVAKNNTWSNDLSFASPEADFVSTPGMRSKSTLAASGPDWSNGLSFTSPEADFVSTRASSTVATTGPAWSNSMSFASPESDFVGVSSFSTQRRNESVKVNFSSAHNRQEAWSNSLSFASPESDFTSGIGAQTHELPVLPRTLKEALSLYTDKALVITTATHPHLIVHVNNAWQSLCGHKKQDVLHHPIGALLQGPKTNASVAKSMTQQVLSSHMASAPESIDAYLVNYKASGDPFVNHITAGPLYIEEEDNQAHAKPDFLVGILEEVAREDVPLRLAV